MSYQNLQKSPAKSQGPSSSKLIRLLPVGIVGVGVLAAVLILLGGGTSVINKKVDVDNLRACAGTNQFNCYKDYLQTRTSQADPATAMADLRAVYDQDSYAVSQCHQLTHVIGHTAFSKYKTMQEAYTHGDSFCWSGYYHGVTETAIGQMGADKVRSQANNLCSGFADTKRYSFDHYNCAHGTGHGFLTVANADLFEALTICDVLEDSWERTSCYGGVYMENVMIEQRGDGKSNYLRPEEPMYPCTAVEYQYKEQCYLMQTSYVLQHNGYDFAAAFEACRTIPDADFIATCYQSIGRDASGSTVSDIERTKANCLQAPDDMALTNCVKSAVRDFVSYFHNDGQALGLCEAFADNQVLSESCKTEVAAYYATFR